MRAPNLTFCEFSPNAFCYHVVTLFLSFLSFKLFPFEGLFRILCESFLLGYGSTPTPKYVKLKTGDRLRYECAYLGTNTGLNCGFGGSSSSDELSYSLD